MVVKMTDVGIEVFPGIVIPWDWIDGLLIGLIEKVEAGVPIDIAIDRLDGMLQKMVDNTKVKFDNVAKTKLEKALTLSMVKHFMPELLENPR